MKSKKQKEVATKNLKEYWDKVRGGEEAKKEFRKKYKDRMIIRERVKK